ncbi:MAG: type II toxin-antitoxin system VapB family antitoxin [Rickettsiales bacterium]|jgi:antitoxin VapB|nr:type II toxin-antitoxin system VapB family antitoxin [Rickettsiales bacterium]
MREQPSDTAPDTAKLFWNGKSQAVRLPKAFRLEGDEVIVRKSGSSVILSPKPKSRTKKKSDWDALLASLPDVDDDFMKERPLNRIPKPKDIF